MEGVGLRAIIEPALDELEAMLIRLGYHFMPYSVFDNTMRSDLLERMIQDCERAFSSSSKLKLKGMEEYITGRGPERSERSRAFMAVLMTRNEKCYELLPTLIGNRELDFASIKAKMHSLMSDEIARYHLRQWVHLLGARTLKEGARYIFEEDERLPFLIEEDMKNRGANSTVTLVTIPKEHLELSINSKFRLTVQEGKFGESGLSIKRVKLVRKRILAGTEEENILSKLPSHPSLLTPICTFTINYHGRRVQTTNFLFPQYDGPLSDYLKDDEPIWNTRVFLQGYAELLSGVSLLKKVELHPGAEQEYIAHNDIKSDNIMVNERQRKLVLIDFGSATVVNAYRPKDRHPSDVFHDYLAPEAYKQDISMATPRDVWALGCLLMNFLIYLSSSDENRRTAVGSFRQDRRVKQGPAIQYFFWTKDSTHGEVLNSCVRSKFAELDGLTRDGTLNSDEAKAIIEIAKDMLSIQPGERPQASEAAQRLESIVVTPSKTDTIRERPQSTSTTTSFTQSPLKAGFSYSFGLATGPKPTTKSSESSAGLSRKDELTVLEDTQSGSDLSLTKARKRSYQRLTAMMNTLLSEYETAGVRLNRLWLSRDSTCIDTWARGPISSVLMINSALADIVSAKIGSLAAAYVAVSADRDLDGVILLSNLYDRSTHDLLISQSKTEKASTDNLVFSLMKQLCNQHDETKRRCTPDQLERYRGREHGLEELLSVLKYLNHPRPLVIVIDGIAGQFPFDATGCEVVSGLINWIHASMEGTSFPPPVKLLISLAGMWPGKSYSGLGLEKMEVNINAPEESYSEFKGLSRFQAYQPKLEWLA